MRSAKEIADLELENQRLRREVNRPLVIEFRDKDGLVVSRSIVLRQALPFTHEMTGDEQVLGRDVRLRYALGEEQVR